MKAWPQVALADLLSPAGESIAVQADASYANVGMYSFGRGLFRKSPIKGVATSAKTLNRIRSGDFIYSRLFGFEGAYGVVDEQFDGSFVSNEYPSFSIDDSRLIGEYLRYYFRRPSVWQAIALNSKGVGSRRIRVHPDRVLAHRIPLPPLEDQRGIVSKLVALAEKSDQIPTHFDAIERDADHLLALRFQNAIAGAPCSKLSEIAPIQRRPVALTSPGRFREVGARSFGKGLFAKPDFEAEKATWEKPVWIEAGDLVFSNIKAWEGAIAIATEQHHGCIASHRYITCVVDQTRSVGSFVLFYLLSSDGLEKVGSASPGTADRNRTLSPGKLGGIEIPVPPLATQRAFVDLHGRILALKASHTAIREANKALVPATIEKLFSRV